MLSKVFKTGDQLAIPLPDAIITSIGVQAGDEVWVELDRKSQQIVICSAEVAFDRHITEFINEYRPALEALAEK